MLWMVEHIFVQPFLDLSGRWVKPEITETNTLSNDLSRFLFALNPGNPLVAEIVATFIEPTLREDRYMTSVEIKRKDRFNILSKLLPSEHRKH
jgi:hypothetical protein